VREEGWEDRGRGQKGPNFIAKFGRYVSIIGAIVKTQRKTSAFVLSFIQLYISMYNSDKYCANLYTATDVLGYSNK
jgi:hypothetical protein